MLPDLDNINNSGSTISAEDAADLGEEEVIDTRYSRRTKPEPKKPGMGADKTDLYAHAESVIDRRNARRTQPTGLNLSSDPDVEILRTELNRTREEYDRRLMGEMHQQSEVWHDYAKSVETAQQLIEQQMGRKLRPSENAYNFENQMHSMNQVEVERFEREYYEPLLKEVARLRKEEGIDLGTLEDYMIAKSGLERNEVLAERDAQRALPRAVEKAKADTKRTIDDYESKLAALEITPKRKAVTKQCVLSNRFSFGALVDFV